MTKTDRNEEWTVKGRRLGYRRHVSPFGGSAAGICWATVDLDTNEVIATEHEMPGLGEGVMSFAASCHTHQLVVPQNVLKNFKP